MKHDVLDRRLSDMVIWAAVILSALALIVAAVSLRQAVETRGSGGKGVHPPEESDYVDISVEEAKEMIVSQNVVVLDVRSQAEFESGHIPGAKLVPLPELEERIDELNKDQVIIVYCRTGSRSREASEILVQHGFENVYNMLGGVAAWMDAGFPIVSGSGTQPANSTLSSRSTIY